LKSRVFLTSIDGGKNPTPQTTTDLINVPGNNARNEEGLPAKKTLLRSLSTGAALTGIKKALHALSA
jgi:hypothetical protein